MLENLNNEFRSKTVLNILSNSNIKEISKNAIERADIVKKAAMAITLDRVEKTSLKAKVQIDKAADFGRSM